MTSHTLLAGLLTAAVSLTAVEAARADHCRCNGGYSIGGCTTPSARVYSGTTYYSQPVVRGYYYSPYPSHYRSYSPYGYSPYGSSPYGYSRSGISIRIGSGVRSGYGYRPYGYRSFGYGSRYGSSFGFGSSLHRHRHYHFRH